MARPPVPPAEETTAAPEDRRSRFRTWIFRLALVAISAIVTLGVLELAVRILGYQPIYDVYSKPEAFWRKNADLGWDMTPDTTGTYVGPRPFPIQFRSEVDINSLGFRGPEPRDDPRSVARVAILGDSQAVGFEVEWDETYGARLEERLERTQRVEVVNAAVRGYGTDQELLMYTDRVAPLGPEVVILHVTANDPDDNVTLHRARRPFGKPAFVKQDGDLRLVGDPVPEYPFCSSYRVDDRGRPARVDSVFRRSFCWFETRLADRSALFSFVSVRLARNPRLLKLLYDVEAPAPPERARRATRDGERSARPKRTQPVRLDRPHRITSDLILELARRTSDDGARLLLTGERADLATLDTKGFADAGITTVLLDDALGSDRDAVRFAIDGHLNREGHRRVAEALLRPVERELRR